MDIRSIKQAFDERLRLLEKDHSDFSYALHDYIHYFSDEESQAEKKGKIEGTVSRMQQHLDAMKQLLAGVQI
jgi:hypothetical protein